jgi:hypothetical protein
LRQDNQAVRTSGKEQNQPDLDTGEAAAYMAEMAGSLAAVARQHGLDTLAYLFDMAHEEAQNNAPPSDGRRGRQQPPNRA